MNRLVQGNKIEVLLSPEDQDDEVARVNLQAQWDKKGSSPIFIFDGEDVEQV